MAWWTWLVLGFAFAAAEILTPGSFFFVFFGLSALVVGAALGFGLPLPVWLQVVLFCALSVGALALFRKPLRRLAQSGKPPGPEIDSFIGELATTTEDLAAEGAGRVELRGTTWSACNATAKAISAGTRCRVDRVEGLTLWIHPEE